MAAQQNNNKVFIVKMKYDNQSHFSRVKRVFFEERNAMDFIEENKGNERYKGAFWILSDREISDYVPCISNDEVEEMKIEAVQGFIEKLVSNNFTNDREQYDYLEEEWAILEEERLSYDKEL